MIDKKRVQFGLIISFVPLLLSLLFWVNAFESWQNQLTDLFFIEKQAPSDIIIIGIDDQSITEQGGWPFARNSYVDLLNTVTEANPQVVAFDISFFENTESDQELVEVLSQTEVPIVFAGEISDGTILYPIDSFKPYVTTGFVNLTPDQGGVIRKASLQIEVDDTCLDSWAFSVYKLTTFRSVSTIACNQVFENNKRIPQYRDSLIINFNGGRENFTTISYNDVVNGTYPSNIFKNKIVLVGATARNLHDEYQAPTDNEPISGVEIHANIINTLRNQAYLQKINQNLEFFILLAYMGISIIVTRNFAPTRSFVTNIVLSGMFILAIFYWFDAGFIVNMIYPLLGIWLSWVAIIVYKYYSRHAEVEKIKNAFGQYVSGPVLLEILENIDTLQLGGKKAEVSIIFSDIRGFTNISEQFEAEKLVPQLSKYLTAASKEILNTGGVVDKYIGDAIMAFWGAPIESHDHALQACLSARAMMNACKEFNAQRPEWLPEFKIGIGINSGEVNVGNIGSEDRFDYTIIGDAVNLGSRLEGLTKYYRTDILVSENTINLIGDEDKHIITDATNLSDIQDGTLLFRFLDEVRVKGKTTSIKIYSLVHDYSLDFDMDVVQLYSKAYKLYKSGQWDQSATILKELQTDGPSNQLLERITNNEMPDDLQHGWQLDKK